MVVESVSDSDKELDIEYEVVDTKLFLLPLIVNMILSGTDVTYSELGVVFAGNLG